MPDSDWTCVVQINRRELRAVRDSGVPLADPGKHAADAAAVRRLGELHWHHVEYEVPHGAKPDP